MVPFNENKIPLTYINVVVWARSRFPHAFDTLPSFRKMTFEDSYDIKYDRPIRRSLGRSKHKKLLVVGSHVPRNEVEDALVYAHLHAGDTAIEYFW